MLLGKSEAKNNGIKKTEEKNWITMISEVNQKPTVSTNEADSDEDKVSLTLLHSEWSFGLSECNGV